VTAAYIGLGSNLGDRRANLVAAVEALDWGDTRITARSGLYETDPVGGPQGQPDFLNQVIAVQTALDARALFERCQAVEAALGREREAGVRWGPRTIDVDLLLHGETVVRDADLELPHPRMHERAFVLVPLEEIAPGLIVPRRGPVRALLASLGETAGVRRVA